MLKNYYLYLDESSTNKTNIKHLCLGGVIIEKTIYENKIVKSINYIKQQVFEDTSIILHESELRSAKGCYKPMRVKAKRELFWSELKKVFEDNSFKTIGAAINVGDYKKAYCSSSTSYLNDEYFIVLQIVLENFVHFLEINNGIGTVYIESRNPVEDKKIKNIYYKIRANGTLYLNADIFQDKLFNINFNNKADNIIGLQLADFIPGQLNRSCNDLKPKEFSLLEQINSKLYDGNCDMPNRFGFKIMP